MNCSKEGIRHYLGLSNDAFYGTLLKDIDTKASFDQGYALRNFLIRMKQMEVAMDGNIKMLIHLGKVYLGQTDKVLAVEHTNTKPLLKINNEALKEMARRILIQDKE
ncbi:hypothetical protein EF513_05020 [Rickettsiales endosymbiont of Stachyamoeba lipophora]|nr:hypothetical protein EF513_05020 [Rickettsiales endosymbiont of Stachyamoeba lipophora]